MEFGRVFLRILQAIWEANLAEGPVQVSKLDVMDAYCHSKLWLYQVGAFSYIVPSSPNDDGIIICIDLILLIGWVDSPKLLCALSEMLTDIANALVDTDLPVPAYGAISDLSSMGLVPTRTLRSLTHIDCYMGHMISAVQGGPERQH